jgi:uridine kinase
MTHADPLLLRDPRALVSHLRALARGAVAPLVVAIDGPSGAGKSTTARMVAEALDAACISCDDFFAADIPAAGWDARSPAQRAADALDWRRLRAETLEPLRAGLVARWFAFDFGAGARADGTHAMRSAHTEQSPRQLVLLDGAYSSRPELSDLLDCTILLEAPASVRRARLAAREDPQFLEAWHARWGAAEEYYFTRIRPAPNFDVILRPK